MRVARRWALQRRSCGGGAAPPGKWGAAPPPGAPPEKKAGWLAESDAAGIFAVDEAGVKEEDVPAAPHWMTRYAARKTERLREAAQGMGGPRVTTATAPEEDEEWEDTLSPQDKEQLCKDASREMKQAGSKVKTTRWGLDDAALKARYPHDKGMQLRARVEERELQRQAKAFDKLKAQRDAWGLHPVHFAKRVDTRLNEYGEDAVSHSQEKLEKEKARWALEDVKRRKELEEEYRQAGWSDRAIYQLFYDWYALLPEQQRFFMQPYYQSMRPLKPSKRQKALFEQMKAEKDLVVFEERNSHRVIRQAMADGKMPFVNLPPPRLIWDPLPLDCIIDDHICGQASVTLERRQGAILLRRWLPNGQKISCEVLGADYLNDIKLPTPLHVDWEQIERNGGFLIHNIMVNAVDHPNNFTVVGRVEDAVSHLNDFAADPAVEFDPRDYKFYPYLWITNPDKYTDARFGMTDVQRLYMDTPAPSPEVTDYSHSATRRGAASDDPPLGRAGRRRQRGPAAEPGAALRQYYRARR
eukprot:TRINITY_DN27731_c0_g1_i1.p1 TRINITY_DN27731_c0_g1~~TRINITY_DN27731_c0_g1_i1.p1  ORF type:complete len:526 (+),score=199.27 TRINITY_DN27731_c0_g1_i1:53-1630(+)